jgi:hypothetical protein
VARASRRVALGPVGPDLERVPVLWRAQAAFSLLVLGGQEAMPLRRHAWTRTSAGAVLTPEVTRLAQMHGLPVHGCEAFLGLGSVLTRPVRDGLIPSTGDKLDRLVGRATVIYADLAGAIRALGLHGDHPRPIPGLAESAPPPAAPCLPASP